MVHLQKGGLEMGYYSTMVRHDEVKTLPMTEEEFKKKWEAFCASKNEDARLYLEQYKWVLNKRDPDAAWFDIEMDDWYSKHYADEDLAEFVSQMITDDAHCLIEFLGDDGPWGYYVTKGSVKDVEYSRMVDGKRIDS
jgi:hypothetical protein